MPEKSEAFAIVRAEGGPWEPFVKHARPSSSEGQKIHAIMFDDGSIWDAYNGWRSDDAIFVTPNEIRQIWSGEVRDAV